MSFSYPTRAPLLCEPERPYNAPRLLTLLRVRVINGEIELAYEWSPSVEHACAGRIHLDREHSSGVPFVLVADHVKTHEFGQSPTRPES